MLAFGEAELEEIINRLSHSSCCAIEQRDIDCAFGRKVVCRDSIEVFHAPGDVVEGKLRRVDVFEKRER